VIEEVAIALLLGIVAASNNVHRHAAVAELVERRRFACSQRGRDEPRPVRDEEPKPVRHGTHVRSHAEAIRPARTVTDQHPVEIRPFVSLGEISHEPGVDVAANEVHARPIKLRSRARPNHPDEFNSH